MSIKLEIPSISELSGVVQVLSTWQDDAAPHQLHPGDIGWFWRFGPDAMAAAVRVWRRNGDVVAVGLRDGTDLVRLTLAPDTWRDEELAHHLVADLSRPQRELLGEGRVSLETPAGTLVRDVLTESGWDAGEPWTQLRRDLTKPVMEPALTISIVTEAQATDRAAVQRAAFDGSTFTLERWYAMAAAPPYADARCLIGHDQQGSAVAGVTVWSAGPGRPGLIEPLGVHRDHRGHGHGTAITVAAAAALQEMGSSSAIVCTPSSNVGAVAAYRSAGFEQHLEVRDHERDAPAIP